MSYRRPSLRVEAAKPCCFIDPGEQWKLGEQKPCGKPGRNVTYSGHNYFGEPHINVYCDQRDKKRLS